MDAPNPPWATGDFETGPDIEIDGAIPMYIHQLLALAVSDCQCEDPTRSVHQIDAERIRFALRPWEYLRTTVLVAVCDLMGLPEANLYLRGTRLLIYEPGAHLDPLADTAQPEGVARAIILLPGAYEGGKLVVEHDGDQLEFGAGGTPHWRWAAWLDHCRHRVEPVTDGVRIAMDCCTTLGWPVEVAPESRRRSTADHR